MKKIFAIFGAATMLFACTKEMNDAPSFADGNGLKIKASIEVPTKVATTQGKNAWEAGDNILLYSAAAGADAGVSLGGTLVYTTPTGGATAEFAPVGEATPSGDKYYAYYPAYDKYPSPLKAADAIGFAAVAANDPVTDYRFVPVTVNTGITFEYDPTSGIAKSTNSYPVFYASADAPKEAGQAVVLTFKPVLPVIEFGLKGYGSVASIVVAYADKGTDVLDNDANKWLTGKGVIDLSTGVLTTTNTDPKGGYSKLTATLTTKGDQKYVELNPETPIYFQMPVGRFEVTKGLTLTITDKDGEVTTKTIWADRKVSGMSENGKCKFISQVINLGSAPVQNADYYEVPMSSIDWTKSYVHHVKDANDKPIAVITKEFFGATVNKQGIVAYPAPSNNPDYTAGKVMQVTLDGDDAPAGNVHGGSLNAWTTAASVVYTAGTSAAVEKLYVKGDGSEISFEAPAAGVVAGEVEPYILTSTSGQEHPLVKIGERFWTACGYKTTKQIDGTAIDNYPGPLAPNTYKSGYYVSEDNDIWLYSGAALSVAKSTVSFTNKIAPEGWAVPTSDDWTTDLADFLGKDSAYKNMQKALLFDRTSYHMNATVALERLGYYCIWSCECPAKTKLIALLCKENEAPSKSADADYNYKDLFEVRLVSVKTE